jgi:hypothetical protein
MFRFRNFRANPQCADCDQRIWGYGPLEALATRRPRRRPNANQRQRSTNNQRHCACRGIVIVSWGVAEYCDAYTQTITSRCGGCHPRQCRAVVGSRRPSSQKLVAHIPRRPARAPRWLPAPPARLRCTCAAPPRKEERCIARSSSIVQEENATDRISPDRSSAIGVDAPRKVRSKCRRTCYTVLTPVLAHYSSSRTCCASMRLA